METDLFYCALYKRGRKQPTLTIDDQYKNFFSDFSTRQRDSCGVVLGHLPAQLAQYQVVQG